MTRRGRPCRLTFPALTVPLALLPALALACGCASPTPSAVPFAGPTPDRILLVPAVGPGVDVRVLDAFDFHVRPAVERRGYATIPVEVARRMLDDLGWDRAAELPQPVPIALLHEQFAVEAVLTTDIEQLSTEGFGAGTLRVAWRVSLAPDGELLWQTELVGSPQQPDRRLLSGPIDVRDPSTDPFFSDEPVLGRDLRAWTTEQGPESLDSFTDGFVRSMARRLPLVEREP